MVSYTDPQQMVVLSPCGVSRAWAYGGSAAVQPWVEGPGAPAPETGGGGRVPEIGEEGIYEVESLLEKRVVEIEYSTGCGGLATQRQSRRGSHGVGSTQHW